ncbi:hypothetical protein OsJ_23460 [Oryza sativa Japonica Group]|uniref:Glycosyltransferase n=1 Tax=Oryza sativa subsp. japonica TaxID=39947 RepID=B9FW15_ORYSJ|nr:hypothetical protein OsJ_23460 [Oryza sativa Japonica Group]
MGGRQGIRVVGIEEAVTGGGESSSVESLKIGKTTVRGHFTVPSLKGGWKEACCGWPAAATPSPSSPRRGTPRGLGATPPAPLSSSSRLRVVPLDLPAVDGLPEGAESTADVPPEKVGLLKKAFDGLAAPFARFVAEACAAGDGEAVTAAAGFLRKPDWIIPDFAHSWIWPIAEEHKIPYATFLIVPAALVAILGPRRENLTHPRTTAEDYMVQPPWIPFPSNIAYRRRHEAEWMVAAFRANASGVSDMDRFWESEQHPNCRLIIYRTCPEIEPRLFPLLTELFAKPAIPAGLLMFPDTINNDDDASEQSFVPPTIEWLDKQSEKSVIYVALGSEAPLTEDHVRELALGLELANVRFLWALRPPRGDGGSNDGGAAEILPDGFESRVAARGIVCTQWVPQLRVLAHRAVGGFLTHCGWGSTIESFQFGHPLVMLPFIVDQGLIAEAMAARGIGVEVARNDDGLFHRDDVAAAVRRVMVEEEGKVLARKAKELSDIVGDREQQEMYLDELVGYLQLYK